MKPTDVPTEVQVKAIEARNELVSRNMRLSIKMAKRFERYDAKAADLISQGYLGLIRAANDYDPDRCGTRFATYACWWIRSFIGAYVADDRMIRLPRNRTPAVARAFRDGVDSLGLTANNAEIIRDGLRAYCYQEGSGADRRGGWDFGPSLDSFAADEPEADTLETSERYNRLHKAMDSLSERERTVIRNRFGFDGDKPRYIDLGTTFGVSKQRVKQIEKVAIRKIRELMA